MNRMDRINRMDRRDRRDIIQSNRIKQATTSNSKNIMDRRSSSRKNNTNSSTPSSSNTPYLLSNLIECPKSLGKTQLNIPQKGKKYKSNRNHKSSRNHTRKSYRSASASTYSTKGGETQSH
jgi:hypothetical protein